jgi:RNA polymerase sigma-70 factor (ECF subfamily)
MVVAGLVRQSVSVEVPGVEGERGRRSIAVLPGRTIGDPAVAEAVAGAFAAHHAEVTAYLWRLTREAEVADDLAQEAFLRLQREIQAGHAPANPRAWLYRVAANLAISRGRRIAVARRRLRATRPDADTGDSPEREVLRHEREAHLDGALAGLSPDARRGLMMAAQGFTGREIAAALGRSEVATRTLLCRARMQLRAQLQEEELAGCDRW